MSNLQWTERSGEGVTAQHKASVGKLQNRKHWKNSGRYATFKKSNPQSLKSLGRYRDWKKKSMIKQQCKADLRISVCCVCLICVGSRWWGTCELQFINILCVKAKEIRCRSSSGTERQWGECNALCCWLTLDQVCEGQTSSLFVIYSWNE